MIVTLLIVQLLEPLEASTSHFTALPNANEMAWYVMKGDPRYDADELWSTMGYLYKGGTWFKKRTYITGFSDSHQPDDAFNRPTQHN